jgi:RimJ/RimL family protein N-acetyltransferase
LPSTSSDRPGVIEYLDQRHGAVLLGIFPSFGLAICAAGAYRPCRLAVPQTYLSTVPRIAAQVAIHTLAMVKAGTMMEIRQLRATDAAYYVRLVEQIDRESRFLMWEPGERQISADDIRRSLTDSNSSDRLRLVALVGDALVGFLVAHRGRPRRVRHRADFTMAVLQDHQSRGIGTELLAALDSWATAVGISRLELTVMSDNEPALALYERAGYSLEGRKRDAIIVDGRGVDELVMGKPLAQNDQPTR